MTASLTEPVAFKNAGVSRVSVDGGLWLQATTNEAGETQLKHQRHAAPIHVSKPYRDGQSLLLQTVSPTAGLLAGDRITLDIALDESASLTLYAPAVTRVHAMSSDAPAAHCKQRFVLKGNAFMEFINEGTVLQRDSSFEQTTEISLSDNADMIFSDIVWPGRIASGEAFEFRAFQSRFQAYRDEKLIAMERSYTTPDNRTGRSWQRALGDSVMATTYVLTRKDLSEVVSEINDLQTESSCWIGATALDQEGLMIRVLSNSSILLKKARQAIRDILSIHLNKPLLTIRTL